MNRSGFGLLEIIIVLGILIALIGGGFYLKSFQVQQNTIQTGNNALQKAKEVQEQAQKQARQEQNMIDKLDN